MGKPGTDNRTRHCFAHLLLGNLPIVGEIDSTTEAVTFGTWPPPSSKGARRRPPICAPASVTAEPTVRRHDERIRCKRGDYLRRVEKDLEQLGYRKGMRIQEDHHA